MVSIVIDLVWLVGLVCGLKIDCLSEVFEVLCDDGEKERLLRSEGLRAFKYLVSRLDNE